MENRYARISGKRADIDSIRRYLPSNYTATVSGDDVIIGGTDDAGWTLDGYVIPRLASGLYFAVEMQLPV